MSLYEPLPYPYQSPQTCCKRLTLALAITPLPPSVLSLKHDRMIPCPAPRIVRQEAFSPAVLRYMRSKFLEKGYHFVAQTKPRNPIGMSSGLMIARCASCKRAQDFIHGTSS